MRARIVVGLLLLWPLELLAQRTLPNRLLDVPKRADSLQAWLHRPGVPDTTRVKLLLDLCPVYANTDLDSMLHYSQRALQLARRIGFDWGEVGALSNLAAAYYYRSDYPAAQHTFEQVLLMARRRKRQLQVGHAYLGLGNVAGALGDPAAQERYFAQAQLAYSQVRPRYVIGELMVLNNRANGFVTAKQFTRARALVRQGLALQARYPLQYHPENMLLLLGDIQQHENARDSACATWQRALQLSRQYHNLQVQNVALVDLATAQPLPQQARMALAYARQAAALAQQLGDARLLANALEVEAAALAAQHLPGAYDTLRRCVVLRDTLMSQDRTEAVVAAQARFDAAGQQARIRGLEQQRRIAALETGQRQLRNRVTLVAGGAAVLLLAAGLAWAYRRRQQRREAALRTRLAADLHDDVGGLLTQISLESALLEEGHYPPEQQRARLHRVAEASRSAARQMSDVVWSVDARNDSFASVLERMHDHAQEVLAPAGIELEFSSDPALKAQPLDLLARQNLYLIFKEALHNVVKHAQASLVQVRLHPAAGSLCLEVCDDGQGGPTAEHLASHGLRNMRMRAEAVGGTVRYENLTPGFGVVVRLPLR